VVSERTAERLMDLAEDHIRNAGYGGFSFRDLAAEIGIKSASVHHRFPTKATMAAAVARRYGDRFLASVADAAGGTISDGMMLCESVLAGVVLGCFELGSDAKVLDLVVGRVKERLAKAHWKTSNPKAMRK
jgi:AcrR family transcriptional regulator